MVGFCEHGSETMGSIKRGNLSSCGTVGFLRRTVPGRVSHNGDG